MIKLLNKTIDNTQGCFIKYKDLNIIVIDPTLNKRERNCIIQEELGHFYLGATYSINCNNVNYISKQEHKARKYAFETLVPLPKLKSLMKKYDLYECAEELNVTDKFLQECIKYYVEKYGQI